MKCTRMAHPLAVTLFVVDGVDGDDSLRFWNTEGFVSADGRRGHLDRNDQNVKICKYRCIFLKKCDLSVFSEQIRHCLYISRNRKV